MKISFFLRHSKRTPFAFVYCRIEIDNVRADFSTNIKVLPENVSYQPFIIQNSQADNEVLRFLVEDLKTCYNQLRFNGEVNISPNKIKEAYFEQEKPPILLRNALSDFVYVQQKKRLNIEIRLSSFLTYESRLNCFLQFLKCSRKEHILADNLNVSVLEKFAEWAVIERGYSNGFTRKVINQVKASLKWALREEMIDIYRLEGFNHKNDNPKPIYFLNTEQVTTLKELELRDNLLNRVRDAMLFQIYTSFDYVDLKEFCSEEHIKINTKGVWIKKIRGKRPLTGYGMEMLVPVKDELKELLDKYVGKTPLWLPHRSKTLSYDKYNQHVKLIGKLLEVDFKISTKIMRKTFAMYHLNKGASYEVVARMVGHNSIKTTQRSYAKVEEDRILRELNLKI